MVEVNVFDFGFSVVTSEVVDVKKSGVVTSNVLECVGGTGVELLSDDIDPRRVAVDELLLYNELDEKNELS